MEQEYTDMQVTAWGGMQEMKRIIDKTGINKKLQSLGLPEGKSNNKISASDTIESFWVSIWIGCFRFSHTAVVRLDEVLRQIFGWERVPSATTYGRFFKKFTPSMNHDIFIELYSWFFEQLQFDNYTLDVDSSVITRHGEQEGAKKGYNPTKRGRNSHHPLFAFVNDIKMVANCWNRSGNTNSSNNCIHFLEETFSILKNKKIGLFRADSGFCSESILKFIEDKTTAYVMSCKLYANLQSTIYGITNWQPIGMGIWITEITFKQGGWSKARRIIVIKQLEEVRHKTTGKKLTSLFKQADLDKEKVYKTRYHAFVTNQTLPAIEIWEQYKRRGDAENRIKELKEDFGVQGFCMDSFCATETAMRFVMIAYNLMSLFRLLTLQKQPSPTLATLRFNCFAVGSWIENKVLKMSVPLKRRQ
ncbi:IS1380 family transposase [Parasediminibacterium sp. JCM 36343]|uniref:IS1380 family transposase n=1 Tax=Parasediminibacterium sp. JCM 36343 TaxID=3374279 RepID=UPI00397DF362